MIRVPRTNQLVVVPHRALGIANALLLQTGADGQPLPLGHGQPSAVFSSFHLHRLSDELPGPGEWCVCYLDGPHPVGIAARDAGNEHWFEGEGLDWLYTGYKITETTDPQLHALGIAALDPNISQGYVARHVAYKVAATHS